MTRLKLDIRNEEMAKRYNELLSKKTAKGRSVHSLSYVIEKLSDEFYLSEESVMRIIREQLKTTKKK